MGYKAVEQLVKVIKGTAEPSGRFEAVPGIPLSRADPEAVKQRRKENGID